MPNYEWRKPYQFVIQSKKFSDKVPVPNASREFDGEL